MSDPSDALQVAIYDALVADAGVGALVADRVFDKVSVGDLPEMPYVAFGDFQALDDGGGCIDGSEVFVTLHVWSRQRGTREAKQVVSAVRKALHEADLALGSDHRLIEIMFRDSRVFFDADGLTAHGVLTFRALTETAV